MVVTVSFTYLMSVGVVYNGGGNVGEGEGGGIARDGGGGAIKWFRTLN